MPETWEGVLERLERDLDALRATVEDLDGQPAAPPAFTPPPGLGPMPPELARRAIGLAAAYDEAVKRAEAEAQRVGEELRRLSRAPRTTASDRARVTYHS
jgi:hypothetical protein